jgi:6-phosphogluconolactonase
METHIYENKEAMASALANWICEKIASTLQSQEYFSLVLSGGNTPTILYKKLATTAFKDKIDWSRIHVFWGDERVVPYTDKRNNAKMAFDLLLNSVTIPPEHIHIMRTDIEPNFAVDAYQALLHTFFDNKEKSFDLVLLGMGEDGHTLSLFPGSTIIEEHVNWVNSIYNSDQKMYRITLMPLIVNKASSIVFMVDGSKKSEVLQKVINGKYNPVQLPAQIIKPIDGELHWFLDEAAAKNLSSTQF